MKNVFTHKLRIAALSVFTAGVVTFSLALYSKAKPKQSVQGFTLYSTMTTTPKDGQPVKTGTRVRYQRSDGTFKQVTTYYNPDGAVRKTDVLFGEPNHGVFAVDEKAKTTEFISGLKPSSIIISEDDLLKNHHNIVREDSILGYRVMVARLNDDGNGSYLELYHAPALMGFQIKTVDVNTAGYKLVIEPTKIVLGDPSNADLSASSNYPIAYNIYEQKIKALEERGENESATEMKHILEASKSGKP